MAKEVITGRVDADLVAKIDALADKLGLTRSECVEAVLRMGVEGGERFASALTSPVIRQIFKLVMSIDGEGQETVDKFERMFHAAKTRRRKPKS